MKFTDVLTEKKKENIYVAVQVEKQQRKTERKWKTNEIQVQVYENLKLGD